MCPDCGSPIELVSSQHLFDWDITFEVADECIVCLWGKVLAVKI